MDKKLTPEALGAIAREVEQLRFCCVYNINIAGDKQIAGYYYLLAVSSLEQASHFFMLAKEHA